MNEVGHNGFAFSSFRRVSRFQSRAVLEKASWKSPPNEANTGAKESASIPQEKVDYLDGAGIKTGTRSRYRYSWHQCSSCRDASK